MAHYRRQIACFLDPLQKTIACFWDPFTMTISTYSANKFSTLYLVFRKLIPFMCENHFGDRVPLFAIFQHSNSILLFSPHHPSYRTFDFSSGGGVKIKPQKFETMSLIGWVGKKKEQKYQNFNFKIMKPPWGLIFSKMSEFEVNLYYPFLQ